MAVIRFALYVDLMLLFGLPAFLLYNARQSSGLGAWMTWLIRALALLAPILAIVGFAKLCADMAGLSLFDLDKATIETVLWATPIGTAWLVRMTALAAYLIVAILPRKVQLLRAIVLPLAGGIALASLAWNGHGAAGDWTRLIADIVHLLSAGLWVGALVAFALMLMRASQAGQSARMLYLMLARFAVVGSLAVAAIVASGLINAWQLVGPEHIAAMWSSPYGRILSGKLVVFTAMLALAAANRFLLTPRLERSLVNPDQNQPLAALRRSVAIEMVLALTVLALVAYLGLLEPPSVSM